MTLVVVASSRSPASLPPEQARERSERPMTAARAIERERGRMRSPGSDAAVAVAVAVDMLSGAQRTIMFTRMGAGGKSMDGWGPVGRR